MAEVAPSRQKKERRTGAGARQEQGRSGTMPWLGQEHGRSGHEQCKSRTGALDLYLLPVSAPIQYFVGRSRAEVEQEQSRSRAGTEQEQGRS